MKTPLPISDEQLSAFVDDQLGAEERNEVFLALQRDEALSLRVCELRKLKDLMRHAYASPPRPTIATRHPRRIGRLTRASIAATLLITGSALGWFGHLYTTPINSRANFHELSALKTLELNPVAHQDRNIILHLSSNDAFKVSSALDEAEQLLESYRAANIPITMEVVANGDGLSMLRAESSPIGEQTQELLRRFDNIEILACANTLKILELQGVNTGLLPNIHKTRSALEKVVNRLQDGWLYIKV